MTAESKEIIKRLKECIKNSGLTYLELEKRTGIAKSSLQRYANGVTKKIPVDSIQTIAKAIGVAPEYILCWDKSQEKNTETNIDTDKDIRRIERARSRMTEDEKNKMMKILELSFDEYFSDDFIDEDTDE